MLSQNRAHLPKEREDDGHDEHDDEPMGCLVPGASERANPLLLDWNPFRRSSQASKPSYADHITSNTHPRTLFISSFKIFESMFHHFSSYPLVIKLGLPENALFIVLVIFHERNPNEPSGFPSHV